MQKSRIVGLVVGLVCLVVLVAGAWFKASRPAPSRAAGETHLYTLIEVTTPLTDEQKILIRDALLELGRQYDVLPNRKTHVRKSLDNQKVIVELVLPDRLTKAQVVTKLAEKLPWSEETISNNSNFQVFGGLGATWEESRQEAVNYLIANSTDWEPPEE